MLLARNHAFQQGDALYIDSTHSVQSRFHCFLQNDHGQINDSSPYDITLLENSAKIEGQSVYVCDAQSCFNNTIINYLIFAEFDRSCYDNSSVFQLIVNSKKCAYQLHSFQEKENERRFRK